MDTRSIIWTTAGANAIPDGLCVSTGPKRQDRRWPNHRTLVSQLRISLFATRKARSAAILGAAGALDKAAADPCVLSASHLPPLVVRIADSGQEIWRHRTFDEIDNLLTLSGVDRLIVALPLPRHCDTEAILGRMIDLGTPLSLIDTEAAQTANDNGGAETLRPIRTGSSLALWSKAAIDRAGAALLLVILAPLLLTLALLIRLTSRGPALFVQPRLGRDNVIIPVVKFRTMYIDRGDPSGGLRTIPDDPRVTRLGRLLRRWSLDELPQLFNVVAGQMSLVGPRPHAVMMKAGERLYFEAVPGYLRRHRVKPGITGWAQVNRLSGQVDCAAAGHKRLLHDLHYIDNWSIWLDLKIFWKTIRLFFDRVNRY